MTGQLEKFWIQQLEHTTLVRKCVCVCAPLTWRGVAPTGEAVLQLSLLMPHILPGLAKPTLATEVLPALAWNSPSVWEKNPQQFDLVHQTISFLRKNRM